MVSLKCGDITEQNVPLNLTRGLRFKIKLTNDIDCVSATNDETPPPITDKRPSSTKKKKTRRKYPNIFKCIYCPQKRRYLKDLKDHMAKHRGDPQYACDLCEKKYTVKYSLKYHYEKIHLDIKRHICLICSELFYDNTELKKHLKKSSPCSLALMNNTDQ